MGRAWRLSQTDAGEFILFTDLDEKATKEAAALERMYRALVRTLELPAETRLFQGKAVVFLLTKRDEFVHLEREAFGVDPNGAIGMCHLRDADVFVVCHKAEDETAYMSTLIHETVHGFMYRYKSPAELPIWANEGLADYIAGFLLTNSLEPGRHWTQAKAFVRLGRGRFGCLVSVVRGRHLAREGLVRGEPHVGAAHVAARCAGDETVDRRHQGRAGLARVAARAVCADAEPVGGRLRGGDDAGVVLQAVITVHRPAPEEDFERIVDVVASVDLGGDDWGRVLVVAG